MAFKELPSLWCLYHIPSGRCLQGLLFEEVRAVSTSLDSEDIEKWLVWKEGWPDWRKLEDHEGLNEPLQRPLTIASPPPVPETFIKGVSEQVLEEVSTVIEAVKSRGARVIKGETPARPRLVKDEPSVSAPSVVLPEVELEAPPVINLVDEAVPFEPVNFIARKSKRYSKRYEVTVVFGQQEFKTHTVDVSIGGLKLEDSLPQWVGLQFKLRIKKPNAKNQIELLAFRIQSKHDPSVRYRVGFLPLKNERDEANLESWLAAA